jgi:2-succinyl-6-hydroxy-2,4-cyclohexadiene-1-carboxylate synthase
MRMETGFVDHDGERIYFETVGAQRGPVVVFTHGMGGNHMIWYQQVAYFAPFCRVITWDQRGFGRSTNAAGNVSPRYAVADLAALLQHLAVDVAHVVGQSLGGWASLGYALRHPQRVRSLVLADTIAGIHTSRLERDFREYSTRVAAVAAQAAAAGTGNSIECHPALERNFGKRDRAKAFLYNQISSVSLAPPVAALRRQLPDTFWPADEVAQMRVPTLFVVGEHDAIFSPELIREAASQVPDATVREMPRAGHSPYFETPDAWNAVVHDFIQAHSDRNQFPAIASKTSRLRLRWPG